MESLSRAYVQAIAGKASVNVAINNEAHDYGIDGHFRAIKRVNNALVNNPFILEFQLKASTRWHCDDTHIMYDMQSKAYNKIAEHNNTTRAMPNILILLCLPSTFDDWMEVNEEQLILRKCCYWERLKDKQSKNTGTVRIRIPREQHLTTESLRMMLNKVERGDW
jgi:hypothetical protein